MLILYALFFSPASRLAMVLVSGKFIVPDNNGVRRLCTCALLLGGKMYDRELQDNGVDSSMGTIVSDDSIEPLRSVTCRLIKALCRSYSGN